MSYSWTTLHMRFPYIIWEFPLSINVPYLAPKSILCGLRVLKTLQFPTRFWWQITLKAVESLLNFCKATVLSLPSLIIFHYCPPHYAKTVIKEKSAGCSCQKQCWSLSHQTLFTRKVCGLQSFSSADWFCDVSQNCFCISKSNSLNPEGGLRFVS